MFLPTVSIRTIRRYGVGRGIVSSLVYAILTSSTLCSALGNSSGIGTGVILVALASFIRPISISGGLVALWCRALCIHVKSFGIIPFFLSLVSRYAS